MACKDQYVCNNYVLLKPKQAGVFDLIRLLFASDLNNRSFIDCSEAEGNEPRNFRRRWIIFISVVAQKVVILLRWPMALLGHLLVWWLNLLASNGGLLELFRNLFKGKVMKPEKSSSLSVLGCLDVRVDLDNNIKPGNKKYRASLSIMAAKLSYENDEFIQNVVQNHWKMHFLGFYKFWNGYLEKPSTPAFIFQDKINDPKLIVVAFRGTEPFDAEAWRTDFDISWYELENVGKMHGGFAKALGMDKNNNWPPEIEQDTGDQNKQLAYYAVKKMLKDLLQKHERAQFILTGHSLGGALAILFMAGLAIHDEAWLMEKLEGVYTFGQPRVGDEQFGNFMKEKLQKYNVKYRRYVYCYDMVPRIPYDDKTLLFKHFGPCLYFNSCYKGKVLEEEPDKNYFSLFWMLPKYINAVWELIRGFIMPYRRGSDYKEGWFMRLLRVVGLIIPGLAAHSPQDYVNLTRLGSLPPLVLQNPTSQGDAKVD
ncbi:hypothetical protein UlMin_035047 [Ulmus minor]